MILAASDPIDFAPPQREKFQSETFPPAKGDLGSSRMRQAPRVTWSMSRLTALAKREHARVHTRRVRVTPHYWRLGRALNLIRRKRKFPRGTWEPWLAAHEITKLNAFRGRRLASFFSSAKDLHRLSLEDALEMAKPKRGQTAADARLCRWLRSVKKKAQSRLDQLDGVAVPGAARSLIADAQRELAALDHACLALERARNQSLTARSEP